MSQALIAHWSQLGWVAAKTVLLFVVALIGLRIGTRRTLAELSVYDFITAVAVGAIVGRVPNASDTSFVMGAVTLVVLLAVHRVLGAARVRVPLGGLLDHQPAILVRQGRVDGHALRQAQLTEGDLASLLRARGVTDLTEVEYAIFEPGGPMSVVRRGQEEGRLLGGLESAGPDTITMTAVEGTSANSS